MSAELAPQDVGRYRTPIAKITTRAHTDDLRAVLQGFATASRPLIVAGNEVGQTQSSRLLSHLADYFCVPVVGEETFTTNSANFPADHPLYHGNFSAALPVVRDADVVIAFGARLFMEYDYLPQGHFNQDVKIIQIGSDVSELGKLYTSERAVVGHVGSALRELVGMLDAVLAPDKVDRDERMRRAACTARCTESKRNSALHISHLLDALHATLPDDAVIVDESVLSKFVMQRRFPSSKERRYFGTSGGGLGWGMGAAMGVQLAFPDRTVVGFLGDGGALFNIQGLWTAANMKLPVVLILVNNGGYMAVERGLRGFNQEAVRGGHYPGSRIVDPAIDFAGVARGFGVQAVRVTEPSAINDALRWALALQAPVLIDVHVSRDDYI
jgi:benzoylformate decarboxylase